MFANPHLHVPMWMWGETRHEISRRLDIRMSRGLPESVANHFWDAAARVKEQSITEVPEEFYENLKGEALSRLPRDSKDWHVAALALSIESDILTEDKDFFGCGIATWTVETLATQLGRRGRSPFQS